MHFEKIIPAPKYVYRFLPEDFVEAACAGKFLLRRLSYYRGLEGLSDRGDDLDGAVRAKLNVTGHDSPSWEPDPLLLKVGIYAANCTNGTINAAKTTVIEDKYFVLCTSLNRPEALGSEGRNAIIRISNIVEFTRAIASRHRDEIRKFHVGPVDYKEREFDVREADLAPSAFVKQPRFAHEQEVRFLWEARGSQDNLLTDCPDAGALVERVG
ncbi:MAG: hypothetical protein ABL883_14845 [Terricaulis sp.]